MYFKRNLKWKITVFKSWSHPFDIIVTMTRHFCHICDNYEKYIALLIKKWLVSITKSTIFYAKSMRFRTKNNRFIKKSVFFMKAYLVAKLLLILQSQRFWDTGPHRSFLYYDKTNAKLTIEMQWIPIRLFWSNLGQNWKRPKRIKDGEHKNVSSKMGHFGKNESEALSWLRGRYFEGKSVKIIKII